MCGKTKDWGTYFDGGTTTQFARDAYPSPPAPVSFRDNVRMTIQDSGQMLNVSLSDSPIQVLSREPGALRLGIPGIPSSIVQFPLLSLDNLTDERVQRWKLAPVLG